MEVAGSEGGGSGGGVSLWWGWTWAMGRGGGGLTQTHLPIGVSKTHSLEGSGGFEVWIWETLFDNQTLPMGLGDLKPIPYT